MPPPNPRGQQSGDKLSYVERTSNLTVTATVEASAETFIAGTEIIVDGATELCIEIYCAYGEITASQALVVSLWEDSTDKGRIANITPNAGTGNQGSPILVRRFLTPSSGKHTYTAKAWKTGGTATLYASTGVSGGAVPAYIRITRA